jgi:hypothetical protein
MNEESVSVAARPGAMLCAWLMELRSRAPAVRRPGAHHRESGEFGSPVASDTVTPKSRCAVVAGEGRPGEHRRATWSSATGQSAFGPGLEEFDGYRWAIGGDHLAANRPPRRCAHAGHHGVSDCVDGLGG